MSQTDPALLGALDAGAFFMAATGAALAFILPPVGSFVAALAVVCACIYLVRRARRGFDF